MHQFLDIDRSLVEELVRLGYTKDEIEPILNALELNANNAGLGRVSPKRTRFITAALDALIQRFKDVLNSGQYDAFLKAGYLPDEIRSIGFTNLLPTTQLLVNTGLAYASGEYERLHRLGYADVQIRSLIRAGFTVVQLRALADRVN